MSEVQFFYNKSKRAAKKDKIGLTTFKKGLYMRFRFVIIKSAYFELEVFVMTASIRLRKSVVHF